MQRIPLRKTFCFSSYFGFSVSLVSYGSSFAISKARFLYIYTKLSVNNGKAP